MVRKLDKRLAACKAYHKRKENLENRATSQYDKNKENEDTAYRIRGRVRPMQHE